MNKNAITRIIVWLGIAVLSMGMLLRLDIKSVEAADINVSGVISSNTTWTADNVYIVVGDVTVSEGITLTIQAGVTVKFNSNTLLLVNGRLIADGTTGQHVIFTSSNSVPAAGNWKGIYFGSTSTGSILDYCEVRYAGGSYFYVGAWRTAGVLAYGSSPTITNCTFANNSGRAIEAQAAAGPTISDNTATSSGTYFIGADLTSAPTLNLGTNSTSGGTTNAVEVWGGTVSLNATWPNYGVPFVITTNDMTIDAGTTLTLTPGITLKFESNRLLLVNGQLIADGTTGQHVIFTSSNSVPAAGNWKGIYFGSTSTGSILDYCEVRYAGGSYFYVGAWRTAGVLAYGSSPTITNCTIKNNNNYGVYTDGGANPTVSGSNSIYSNTAYGVFNADSTVTINAINNYWGHITGPYHATTNPTGLGNAVSNYVLYRPWLGFDPLTGYRLYLPVVIR